MRKLATYIGKKRPMTSDDVFNESLDATAATHVALKSVGHSGMSGDKLFSYASHEESHQKPYNNYKPVTQVVGFVKVDDDGEIVATGVAIRREDENIPLATRIRSLIQPAIDGGQMSDVDKEVLHDTVVDAIGLGRFFKR